MTQALAELEAPSLSVVIPCHNEAKAIPHLLASLREVLARLAARSAIRSSEVIIVDDCSSDLTPSLLQEHAWVQTVRLDRRSGYGSALKTGFLRARGDWIAFLDMDNTYDPHDLELMIELCAESENVDLLLGNRLSAGKGMSSIRKFGNRLFSGLARQLVRCPVGDVCTGYRLFRRTLVRDFCELPYGELNYSLAMTLWATRAGLRLKEMPIRYHERSGESKLVLLKDGPRFLWTILSYFLSPMPPPASQAMPQIDEL